MLSVPELQYRAILGKDFLRQHKAVIDFGQEQFPDAEPIWFQGTDLKVMVECTIVLYSKTETIVPAKLERGLPLGTNGLVEPNPNI